MKQLTWDLTLNYHLIECVNNVKIIKNYVTLLFLT